MLCIRFGSGILFRIKPGRLCAERTASHLSKIGSTTRAFIIRILSTRKIWSWEIYSSKTIYGTWNGGSAKWLTMVEVPNGLRIVEVPIMVEVPNGLRIVEVPIMVEVPNGLRIVEMPNGLTMVEVQIGLKMVEVPNGLTMVEVPN
ncbi:hypothetical protein RRG08_047447 [Elysia crispata]|uniref:Uncharacterized protein n=1 Tax=Elysia crispata TaxID=231223 RepID=A0AAE0YVH4_9GAST|nr:hypothetical protein RRG08_047447 [Elysia crispata]